MLVVRRFLCFHICFGTFYLFPTVLRHFICFHHHIGHLINPHVGHIVNLHVRHHVADVMSATSSAPLSTSMTSTPITSSNIISLSIINRQSLISKVFSRYLHSSGSHQSSRFITLTHLVTHPGSIASHNAKHQHY